MSNIDKQRYAAVRILESMGFTWDGADWKPPLGSPAAREGVLNCFDRELLAGAIERHMAGYHGTPDHAACLKEIMGWGWFK